MGNNDTNIARDKFGRRCDCFFYRKRNKRIVCDALRDFYNVRDKTDQCKNCPFFKTPKEFFESAGDWAGGTFSDIVPA